MSDVFVSLTFQLIKNQYTSSKKVNITTNAKIINGKCLCNFRSLMLSLCDFTYSSLNDLSKKHSQIAVTDVQTKSIDEKIIVVWSKLSVVSFNESNILATGTKFI